MTNLIVAFQILRPRVKQMKVKMNFTCMKANITNESTDTLFSNHTCMFRSSSATILRVYILKSTIKAVCVANQTTIHAVRDRPCFNLQRITTFQT